MKKKFDDHIFFKLNRESTILSIILDKDFRIEYFNIRAEELLSLNTETDYHKSVFSLEKSWSRKIQDFEAERNAVKEENINLPDIQFINSNGEEIILGLSIRRVTEKEEYFYLITGQDITDKRRKEAETLTDEKLKAIGELASGIVHDLRSPLQFIKNDLLYIQQISKDSSNQDFSEIHEAATESLKGINQIEKLTGALTNFVHPENTVLEDFNLKELLYDAVFICRNQWIKNAALDVMVSDNIGTMKGHPADITRLVINLITNASQAIKEAGISGGKILVKAEKVNHDIKISVSDNGPGIPEKNREKIFEPFFTTKPKGIGTGQGLAISRSIAVNKLGGSISFKENQPRGSIFELIMPGKEEINA